MVASELSIRQLLELRIDFHSCVLHTYTGLQPDENICSPDCADLVKKINKSQTATALCPTELVMLSVLTVVLLYTSVSVSGLLLLSQCWVLSASQKC